MDGDGAVEHPVDAAAADVRASHVAGTVEVDGVATQLERLVEVVKLSHVQL